MTLRSVSRVAVLVIIGGALAALTAISTGAVGRSRPAPAQLNPPSDIVQTLPAGTRFGAKPGQKGATYYWLEGQTRRLTMRFADATTVAERGADGDINVRITDASGNDAGRFKVDRIDESTHVLHYDAQPGSTLQVLGAPSLRPTLDWANRQAYALVADRVGADTRLVWQNGFMRPAAAAATRNIETAILEVRTEWANGLSATAARRRGVRLEFQPGRILHGDAVISRLTKDDVEVGISNWFPEQQVFLWDLPGVSQGYLDPNRLSSIGGWQFQPDIAWVNLQAIAFHHFKTVLDQNGTVASCQPGLLERATSLFVARVHANEPGCDGLHWLDGTVYRYCCDVHDYCYAQYGCSSSSWWQWWSSWTCTACNGWAVWCFYDGFDYPMQHSPY